MSFSSNTFSTLVVSLLAITTTSAHWAPFPPDGTCVVPYTRPRLRYPPPILRTAPDGEDPHPSSATDWTAPGPQDIYGTYFLTHSTRRSYLTLTNMRAEHYPIFPQSPSSPAGSEVDIVSWSTSRTDPSSTAVTTVFGYFRPPTPRSPSDPVYPATWNYSSTGVLAATTNMYSVLAAGVDTAGVPYRVDYETGFFTPGGDPRNGDPCLNVASRADRGPTEETLWHIVAGLEKLGAARHDPSFLDLVQRLLPLVHDGRRSDEGPVECDEACMLNADLVPI